MTTAIPVPAADPARPTNMGAPMLVAYVEVPICTTIIKIKYLKLIQSCIFIQYTSKELHLAVEL